MSTRIFFSAAAALFFPHYTVDGCWKKSLKAVHKARLVSHNLCVAEDEARDLNEDIFETIYFAACEASCELAAHDGPYETYAGAWFHGRVVGMKLMKLHAPLWRKEFGDFFETLESLNRKRLEKFLEW